MTTFSQLIDEMVQELLRPDLRATIVAYANQTIREVHSQRRSSEPILFASNREEIEWVVPVGMGGDAAPATWAIPSIARFQRLEAAYAIGRSAYFLEKKPARIHGDFPDPDNRYYWYRSGPVIAFGDRRLTSLEGERFQLSYFLFPRLLKYYPPSERPAVYDVETESFTYLAGIDTPEAQADAEEKSTNWVLLRWGEAVVKQGIRAKVYVRLGDDARSKTTYSLYESMREQMNASEMWQQNAA